MINPSEYPSVCFSDLIPGDSLRTLGGVRRGKRDVHVCVVLAVDDEAAIFTTLKCRINPKTGDQTVWASTAHAERFEISRENFPKFGFHANPKLAWLPPHGKTHIKHGEPGPARPGQSRAHVEYWHGDLHARTGLAAGTPVEPGEVFNVARQIYESGLNVMLYHTGVDTVIWVDDKRFQQR